MINVRSSQKSFVSKSKGPRMIRLLTCSRPVQHKEISGDWGHVVISICIPPSWSDTIYYSYFNTSIFSTILNIPLQTDTVSYSCCNSSNRIVLAQSMTLISVIYNWMTEICKVEAPLLLFLNPFRKQCFQICSLEIKSFFRLQHTVKHFHQS